MPYHVTNFTHVIGHFLRTLRSLLKPYVACVRLSTALKSQQKTKQKQKKTNKSAVYAPHCVLRALVIVLLFFSFPHLVLATFGISGFNQYNKYTNINTHTKIHFGKVYHNTLLRGPVPRLTLCKIY